MENLQPVSLLAQAFDSYESFRRYIRKLDRRFLPFDGRLPDEFLKDSGNEKNELNKQTHQVANKSLGKDITQAIIKLEHLQEKAKTLSLELKNHEKELEDYIFRDILLYN